MTDDLYVTQLVEQENKDISFGNIFNILELLYVKDILNEDEFYKKIVDSFSLGIVDIKLGSDLLGSTINYYLGAPGVVNYENTHFKLIFDNLITQNTDFMSKQKLFLDMFNCVDIHNLSSDVLLSLISKLLEFHPLVDPQKVVDTWFIYCGLRREIIKDIDTSISIVHEVLWFKYKDVMEKLNSSIYSSKVLLDNIIRIIKSLDRNVSILAFDNLTSCFSPDSSEYKYLETII